MITKRNFMSYRLNEDQEDDFEFGGKGVKEEEEEEVITEESSEDEEEDEESEKEKESEGEEEEGQEKEEDDDQEEDQQEDDDDSGKDKSESEQDKGKGKEKEKEGKEEDSEEEEAEFFDSLIEDDSEKEKTGEIDFSSFSEDLELEFSEEENAKDKNTFVQKVKQKIQEAQQEFNLNEYPEHTRNLIQYIAKSDGDAMKIFENPSITKSQSIIGMDAEDKVAVVIENQLRSQGVRAEDIDARVEEELNKLSTREIKDAADKINENARNNIKAEIQKIAGDQEKIVEKSRQQQQQVVQQQRENFKKAVDQSDSFLGLKLTDKAKATIKRDLDAGIVEKTSDIKDPYIALNAYIIKKFGKDIEKHIQSKLAESSREGYNKASDKHKQRLHNTKGSAQGKQAGGRQDAQKEKGKTRGWSLDEIE